MKRKTLLWVLTSLTVVLYMPLQGYSQLPEVTLTDTTRVWRTGFYMGLHAQTIDVDNLNAMLQQANQPTLLPDMAGAALGFTMRHRDQNSYSRSQLTYFTLLDNLENDNLRESRVNYWELSVTGNYDVIPSQKWLVYPYLGFGVGLSFLRVSEVISGTSFQGSLNNLNTADLEIKQYMTDAMVNGTAGVGVERRFVFPGTLGFIGISGGYKISEREDWQLRGTSYTLDDSPNFRANGWVFELRFRFEYDPTIKPEQAREPQGLFKLFQ
ncbi:hypothetical protein [Tunicatimonas pelagia]|uniref:hypothetical protein n=1 Tax=Tunicatimonas pelagia TaxID=931531 RepID=UPI0026652667|nr:hypothetical protein [Tunicatimonas pelagia]WKN42928.1 hypothetical protein P0M28_28220 [Tunicatimonas pelagia]